MNDPYEIPSEELEQFWAKIRELQKLQEADSILTERHNMKKTSPLGIPSALCISKPCGNTPMQGQPLCQDCYDHIVQIGEMLRNSKTEDEINMEIDLLGNQEHPWS